MNRLASFLILLALSLSATAQNNDPFRDLNQAFEQMRQQMLRGLPDMQPDTQQHKGGSSDFFQFSPDSSTYFYYKIDTSFGGGSGSTHFFQFSPFGGQSNPQSNSTMPSIEDMMRQMEAMQRQFFSDPWGSPRSMEPTEPEDGLLPEERLRLEEEQRKNPSNGNTPQLNAPVAKPKPKIKTTRI
jgi:hypothetical protein